jgi:anthranilate/para-aminobenzoate synthase component II
MKSLFDVKLIFYYIPAKKTGLKIYTNIKNNNRLTMYHSLVINIMMFPFTKGGL